jgi:hypothetical protein
MRTKHVTRYYCDFCPRGYFAKRSMERHEKGCTANPGRICGLCEYAEPRLTQKPMFDLVECLTGGLQGDYSNIDIEGRMRNLRSLAEGCPGCILAAIRQSGIVKALFDDEYGPPDLKFDFKAELNAWWGVGPFKIDAPKHRWPERPPAMLTNRRKFRLELSTPQ